jgi:hypothetical protein
MVNNPKQHYNRVEITCLDCCSAFMQPISFERIAIHEAKQIAPSADG